MNAVITQSDVATAYGWGMDALWDGLLSGQTAIRPTQRFAERGFVSKQAALVPDLEVEPDGTRTMTILNRLLSPLVGKLDPLTPLILATTVGEIEYVERAILNDRPDLAAESRPQILLGRVKQMLHLRGPAMVISSACASSAVAITRAASLVRSGETRKVLVVCCDTVSEFVYSGFSSLLSLCETPSRPFDADRCGLTLGEAAAWALVASDDAAAECASTTILGWGNTTDAVHMTAPDRQGRGLSRAIAKALRMSGRVAGEIRFIAAHGTATSYNDAMELVAFGGAFDEPRPIFSIKGGAGHSLAAAGLLQILTAGRALAVGVVPGTAGLLTPDPTAVGWAHRHSLEIGPASLALSTNSGFGGVNTAIVLGGGVS